MHRYSTNDPIWRLANNSLQASTGGRLGKTCFMCHAPIGILTDNTKATFEFSELNPLVREGINCDFCHILRPPYVTTNQTIQYHIEPGEIKYGAIQDTTIRTVHGLGYDPSYERSDNCRMCHDLVVNGVPVEITNTEWDKSPWGAMSFDCQRCHMPTYTGKAATEGPIRENLHRHDFIGVDIPMTDFPNKAETIAKVDSLLKHSVTMTLDVPITASASDSIQISVHVYNDKTGHNVPTSVFFFRQMWIEVTAWKGVDTVYRSGHLDENGDLMDTNSVNHHNDDKDLTMFGGTLYKNGHFSNVFELDSLVNNSIPPFATRTANYRFKASAIGMWNVKVRLLFRPFGPHLFRALGAEQYIPELKIFEMERNEALIDVK